MFLLQTLTNAGNSLEPVTRRDIEKHVAALKNQKAADIHGISAEHIKLASTHIISILHQLTTSAFNTGRLPDIFKTGSVTPVIKKSKSMKHPNNYRRITIASIVGKIVEKHMLKNTRPVLDPTQSRLQFGFSTGIAPVYAALVVTELMAEATDTKKELLVTFLVYFKGF